MGFTNNNRGNGTGTATKEELQSARSRLAKADYNYKKECPHKDGKFPANKSISESNRNIEIQPYYRNKDGSVKEQIVVCDICGTVYNTEYLTPDKINESIFTIRSMIEQMKLMFKFDNNEYEQLTTEPYEALDTLSTFAHFYNNAMRDLKDQNKNRNNGNNNGASKGNIGISRSMFNTKNF